MMEIDRQRVKDAFMRYVSQYNERDPKIKLKIDHTYRVAGLSQRIARSLDLSQGDIDLAWLIGMLHDIGRFEQLRRYGTFSDADSIDHAQFGVKLLFEEGLLGQYLPCRGNAEGEEKLSSGSQKWGDGASQDCLMLETIRTAIWNHSAYRIEEGMDAQTQMFCHILRDADKIDILRVNHDVPIEDIYNVTTQDLLRSQVTPAVMEAFFEKHAVLRSLKKTPVDNIVGHSALVFELVYTESIAIVREQGYLQRILDFQSENPVTREQFARLRECMDRFLETRET